MKKLMACVLSMGMLLGLLAACGNNNTTEEGTGGSGEGAATASEGDESPDEYFKWRDDTTIRGLSDEGKEQKIIVVPAKVTLAEEVFFNSVKSSSVEALVFASDETQIEVDSRCFQRAKTIKKIVFPASLESLPEYMFDECESIEEVYMPGVKTVGEKAFYHAENLRIVEMPQVETVGRMAFVATAIESLSLPNARVLEDQAFQECRVVESIDMPVMESIGEQALYLCESLKRIELPETMEYLGNSAFAMCTSLEVVRFPAGLSQIEAGVFMGAEVEKIEVKEGSVAAEMAETESPTGCEIVYY